MGDRRRSVAYVGGEGHVPTLSEQLIDMTKKEHPIELEKQLFLKLVHQMCTFLETQGESQKMKKPCNRCDHWVLYGVPERIRTSDTRFRRALIQFFQLFLSFSISVK